MGILDEFGDWMKKTADIKQLVTTKGSDGRPAESETVIATGVEVAYWTDVSRETNQNSKFVDQALGTVLLDPSVYDNITTEMWLEIDDKKHYVIGVDNVAEFGELLVVKWRRENG